jgi:copper transport protein
MASPASAHNSFVASDPADGAQLVSVPARLTLTFAKDVGLEELQVDFTDATGVRSSLNGFSYAPAGKAVVLVPVPPQAAGAVSFRWKLVASDGHTVSGRVGLTINPPPVDAPPTTVAVAVAFDSIAPNPAVTTTATTTAADVLPSVRAPALSSVGTVGTTFRWLLRLAAFVGLLVLAGSIVTSAVLWGGAWAVPLVRKIAAWGVGLVMGSTLLLLVLFRSEVGSLKVLLNTSYGLALALRLILLPVVAVYLFTWFPDDDIKRWSWVGGMLAAVAATWSWSGHPRSLRWPLIGVPLDLVHLVAACVWIGGLVVLGVVVMRSAAVEEQVAAVKAFAPIASRSVTALVVTGVLQTFRIDRGPGALFTTTHGRLLLAKIVLLGLMLYVANVNRTRVATRLRAKHPTRALRTMLQRAMVTEAAVGVFIMAVTAILIVNSPPS